MFCVLFVCERKNSVHLGLWTSYMPIAIVPRPMASEKNHDIGFSDLWCTGLFTMVLKLNVLPGTIPTIFFA